MKTTAEKHTVETAIKEVNKERGYQIELNRADWTGKWFNFTLKSKSGIPGARKSRSGRNLPCASWHAHGYVMDKIFEIEPDAVINSLGNKLTAGFLWEDQNIGAGNRMSQTSIL